MFAVIMTKITFKERKMNEVVTPVSCLSTACTNITSVYSIGAFQEKEEQLSLRS